MVEALRGRDELRGGYVIRNLDGTARRDDAGEVAALLAAALGHPGSAAAGSAVRRCPGCGRACQRATTTGVTIAPMVRHARSIMLAAMVLLGLVAGPADAVRPCFDVCHLRQGTPLLLVDASELWVRTCTTSKADAPRACILERRDLEGRTLAQAPLAASYDEKRFTARYLRGHTVARLEQQPEWKDLTKPYQHRPIGRKGLNLRLEQDTLVCAAADTSPAIRRPLGCRPSSAHVRAVGIGRYGKPEEPLGVVAVVATCQAARGTREVIATCTSSPPARPK